MHAFIKFMYRFYFKGKQPLLVEKQQGSYVMISMITLSFSLFLREAGRKASSQELSLEHMSNQVELLILYRDGNVDHIIFFSVNPC